MTYELDQDDRAEFLAVTDTSATHDNPVRYHDIKISGEIKTIKFEHGKPTVLPFAEAIKFRVAGFVVTHTDGLDVTLPPVPTDSVKQQISYDECIAKYDELQLDALKIRASQKDGGEIYLEAKAKQRNDIIEFLKGKPPVEPKTVDNEENLIEDEDHAVQDSGLSKEGQEHIDNMILTITKTVKNDLNFANVRLVPTENATELGAIIFDLVAGNDDSDEKVIQTGSLLDLYSEAVSVKEPETVEPKKVQNATDEALALAAEYGLDVSLLQGTGSKGNILKGDVQAFIDSADLQPLDKSE